MVARQKKPPVPHRESVQSTGFVPSPSPQQNWFATLPFCLPSQSCGHETQTVLWAIEAVRWKLMKEAFVSYEEE